ncbi:nSTAND1 domain-containing NTPase [Nonomuraea sp. NPDC002799]
MEPYVGPRSFRLGDSDKFFGRARDARAVADFWLANPLTALCGPSGVGKTSLLQAGVLPLLHSGVTDVLPVGRIWHGSPVPTAALREGHNPLVFAVLSSWSPHDLPSDLSGLTLPAFFRRRPQSRDPYDDPMLTLVAIDRAENLFADTGHGRAEADDFLHQLAEAMQENPNLRVLMVIRDHQLAVLQRRVRTFTQVVEYFLETLTVDAALEATRRPLEGTGCRFSEGAAEALVDLLRTVSHHTPLGTGIVRYLPTIQPLQLQLVCSGLWNALPPRTSVITTEQVTELVNIDQSVSEFCHRMIEDVAHEVYQSQTSRLLAQLRRGFVTDDGHKMVVEMGLTETGGLPARVISALAHRRILTVERRSPTGSCELSHDHFAQALLRGRDPERDDRLTDPAGCLRLAEFARREGEFTRAAAYADAALQRCGGDPRLRAETESVLGNIAYARDDLGPAVDHYDRAVSHLGMLPGTDMAIATLLTGIGRIRVSQGQFGDAMHCLQSAVRRRPDDPVIQAELAWTLWYAGHTEGALEILDSVLDRDRTAEAALCARGEILADLGRPAPALRDLDRVRPHATSATLSAYTLALALDGRVDEADRTTPHVERERSAAVLLRVARVKAAAGHHKTAVDLAQRALDKGNRPPLPAQLTGEADRIIRGRFF